MEEKLKKTPDVNLWPSHADIHMPYICTYTSPPTHTHTHTDPAFSQLQVWRSHCGHIPSSPFLRNDHKGAILQNCQPLLPQTHPHLWFHTPFWFKTSNTLVCKFRFLAVIYGYIHFDCFLISVNHVNYRSAGRVWWERLMAFYETVPNSRQELA